MNIDRHQPHATTANAQTLHTLKEISGSSRCIPFEKDFHLYYKFDEFKRPIEEIARKSQSMLQQIGASKHAWGTEAVFPVAIDDAYEWLVDVNDEVLERVDESVEEFRKFRKEEDDDDDDEAEWENGFGLDCGKKKKGASHGIGSVRVGTKDKNTTAPNLKIPFHIATIRRPQDVYKMVVNNVNQPFQHVWLERSEDGQRFIHPLEKLSVLDFVDKDLEDLVPIKPPSIECTPFKLVEEVKGLKELAAKLCSVNEFAVDLEHNQYRSFQGLTCLMQISTRTEDFVVDTLKLRVHVGPYLREFFKDPTKKKVMHGADRDIVWLQRDFGIYVCNLFDTGQASRVLKLERFSLQYLLLHFCGVTANKEYQNSDWRLRPLPDVMLRYGREDTHYLLYIYDLMRIKLFALSKESESSDNPLIEVYTRSYDVCMQLYEKELLTENSYLHIYGLQGAGFNAQQLAIVSGLCEWRDIVARAEDESTGYVLPNKIILEIANQMPVTTSNLRRLVKSNLPYVERNLDVILSIVRHSMQNAAAFEEAALRLKEARAARVSDAVPVKDGTEAPLLHTLNLKVEHAAKGSIEIENATCVNSSEKPPFSSDLKELKEESLQHQDKNGQAKIKSDCLTSEFPSVSLTTSEKNREDANVGAPSTAKGNGANVQVLKMPTDAFGGALLSSSASKGKLDPGKKGKEEIKLEQIRSSVNLPLHLGNSEKSKLVVETPSVASETSDPQKPVSGRVSTSIPVDIIMIDSETDSEGMAQNNVESSNEQRGKEDEDDSSSFSDLSL